MAIAPFGPDIESDGQEDDGAFGDLLPERWHTAQLSWPMTPRLDLYPTFDYYFVSPGSFWALNFDLKYRPPTRYGAWYLGGGLNWPHGTGGNDTNLNLFTGLESRRGRTRPYVEARFILGSGSSFQIAGGLNWR